MHLYFGGFFALAGLIATAALAAFAAPDPQNTRRSQISLGVAWLCVFLTALIAPAPAAVSYKGAVLFCTVLIGLALAFYWVIPGPRVVAAAFLMVVSCVLFFAFTAGTAFGLPSIFVLLAPVLGVLAYLRFVPTPRVELRPDIMIFLVLMVFTTWQAIELWQQQGAIWSLLAMVGVLVLWAAPAAHQLAQRRAEATRFLTYALVACLLANWFLALSVWTVFDA